MHTILTSTNSFTHYQLFRKIVKHFPLKLQFLWDKSGFMCSKTAWKNFTKRIFIMLDCEYEWFVNQKFTKHDFLIIHHPLTFAPTPKQLLMIKKFRTLGVGLLFLHTNFDLHPRGMNGVFAKFLQATPLSLDHNGFFCQLNQPIKVVDLIDKINQQYFPQQIIYDQKFSNHTAQKIQILLGSGASCIDEICANNQPDLLITGDMKWHDWLKASDYGLIVLDIHHSTEGIFVSFFKNFCQDIINFSGLILEVQPHLKLVYCNQK